MAARVPDDALSLCVDTLTIREHIREAAFDPESQFRYVGLRATAIRVLALWNRSDAFAAAAAAIRDPDSPDRRLYPRLLVELDAPRAVEILLLQAAAEAKSRVLRAIGRALPSEAIDAVRAELTSGDRLRATAACRVAGWLR